MALMTYVRKHPKSGVFEFRRAVPEPLIGRIGKREIRRSLGTRDFTEAKRLLIPSPARSSGCSAVSRHRLLRHRAP